MTSNCIKNLEFVPEFLVEIKVFQLLFLKKSTFFPLFAMLENETFMKCKWND